MAGVEQNRSVLKYIGLFALSYNIFLLAISVLLLIFGESMTGLFYAVAILGAGRVPAYFFIKDNGRLCTNVEKIKLIIGTFLCAIIVSGVLGMKFIYEREYSYFVMQLLDLPILWYVFGPLSKSIYLKQTKSTGRP